MIVVDCGSNKTPEIVRVLDELNVPNRVCTLNELSEKDISVENGIIIGGSRFLLKDRDLRSDLERLAFLKNVSIPTLGICFGHQLLGLLNGAEHWKGKAVRGMENVQLIGKEFLFYELDAHIEMQEDHTEYISLPPNFVRLAFSDSCKNEAMRHKRQPIYGVQFHPETSGTQGAKLIRNFTNICLDRNG